MQTIILYKLEYLAWSHHVFIQFLPKMEIYEAFGFVSYWKV